MSMCTSKHVDEYAMGVSILRVVRYSAEVRKHLGVLILFILSSFLFFALALLGPFLGASWGPLGVLLGSSWGPLGALLGPLGALLAPLEPPWNHLGR